LVLYSLEYFLNDEFCKKVILVINDRDKLYFKNLIKNKKVKFVKGGATRGESVRNGLEYISSDYVIIHDSARPLLYKEDVYNLFDAAKETGGATLATKVYNTTCHIDDNGYVEKYFSRHKLASIITPQCFKKEYLINAYKESEENNTTFTDDSSLFNKYIGKVKLVWSENISIKATTPYDIKLLEVLLYENW
ncbi:MAG: 2-C-methyl-D-erythritol 4-phosphate cytidylyltransferase, partial [Gammaproteobacteria bacterium]|nr:2-C-methyl-D-erythritol 4-phosphate cytidylyltransferase [Gammaproteobacteria bacterium]